MIKDKPTHVQLIINTLMTGDTLRSKEIARRISDAAGQEIKIQDVASMLSRISNENVCDLGYFILKTRDGKSYVYRMADEFLSLSEDKAYGLTRKTGDVRYTLEEAVNEIPGLNKYIEDAKAKPKTRRRKKSSGPERTAPAGKEVRKKRDSDSAASPAPPVSPQTGRDSLQVLADALGKLQNLNIHITVTLKIEEA